LLTGSTAGRQRSVGAPYELRENRASIRALAERAAGPGAERARSDHVLTTF
jgi:hypothetical protein